MTTDYTKVFQDPGAVEKYENITYAPNSYASQINDRQRDYLRALVRREFLESMVDLAGEGRIFVLLFRPGRFRGGGAAAHVPFRGGLRSAAGGAG